MKIPHQRTSSVAYLVVIIITSGASYAMGSASADHANSPSAVVISDEQKPAFLAYARRQNIQSSSSVERTSVGDTLPDVGVTYYTLPLRYGHPFYRYAAIGKHVVVVDQFSGAVIQVLD